jgi:hypothetical protein
MMLVSPIRLIGKSRHLIIKYLLFSSLLHQPARCSNTRAIWRLLIIRKSVEMPGEVKEKPPATEASAAAAIEDDDEPDDW